MRLEETEARVLTTLQRFGGKATVKQVAAESLIEELAVLRVVHTLSERGLLELKEARTEYVELTQEGKEYSEAGLPERRLVWAIVRSGGELEAASAAQAAKIGVDFLPIAVGWLKRKGWAEVEKKEGKLFLKASAIPEEAGDEKLLKILKDSPVLPAGQIPMDLRGEVSALEKRGLLRVESKAIVEATLSEAGWRELGEGIEVVREVSLLTPGLIATGGWREVSFRKYNIRAPVTPTWPGKKQPYTRFLDELKAKLVALGFKEMAGPIVELMFFNCDALYMPQDHPAREIHDIYMIKTPRFGDLSKYRGTLLKVAKAHEHGWKTGSRGWRYDYSFEKAACLILRSHGTALSARTLMSKELEIPGKYFSVVRCYRPDVIDKTHLTEFNQVEGIVVGEDLTLRDLLGVLERFARDIAGADKVRFRPDYFPFTEPSVELLAYKEGYGWMEFGGSGIFRPELTAPLGISVPVIAWGLGVDRLFMMRTGIDDIRMLFTYDLDWMRRRG